MIKEDIITNTTVQDHSWNYSQIAGSKLHTELFPFQILFKYQGNVKGLAELLEVQHLSQLKSKRVSQTGFFDHYLSPLMTVLKVDFFFVTACEGCSEIKEPCLIVHQQVQLSFFVLLLLQVTAYMHITIHQSSECLGLRAAYPSCRVGWKAGYILERSPACHIHTYGQFKIANQPKSMYVFGLWEEAGESPLPHRKGPASHRIPTQDPVALRQQCHHHATLHITMLPTSSLKLQSCESTY